MAFLRPWLVVALSFFLLCMAWRHQADPGVAATANKLLDVIQIMKRATGNEPKPFKRHIVAVGDLHGDMYNTQRVLKFARVTDSKGDWSGEVDFFVQTGDIMDRFSHIKEIFTLMNKLYSQAPRAGGTVLLHMGNHEWMNAIGDWRDVHPEEFTLFGAPSLRREIITHGWIGKSWSEKYKIASRLPLHPKAGELNDPYPKTKKPPVDKNGCEMDGFTHAAISFVHGGLSPTYSQLLPFPSRMNELGSSLLRKVQQLNGNLPADTTKEELELLGDNGPLWYRGWATEAEEVVCKEVDKVLHMTGTRRMVMGHTPNFKKIVSRCGGKIIIIDTGISRAYGGVLSALDIQYSLTPVFDTKGLLKKWREKEVIHALYENRAEFIVDETWDIFPDGRRAAAGVANPSKNKLPAHCVIS